MESKVFSEGYSFCGVSGDRNRSGESQKDLQGPAHPGGSRVTDVRSAQVQWSKFKRNGAASWSARHFDGESWGKAS